MVYYSALVDKWILGENRINMSKITWTVVVIASSVLSRQLSGVEIVEQPTAEWFTQTPQIAVSEVRDEAPADGESPRVGQRDKFWLQPGFQIELLYTVPKQTQGSWVNMTFDQQGRIIASSEEGKGLYRIIPPKIGSQEETRVEKMRIQMPSAHGLLYAFDSLYVMQNGNSGLYRLRDTTADDQFDQVELLKEIKGAGEHGPHAIVLAPDGQSLLVVAGNHTDLPIGASRTSRVPNNWGEDLLLPRQWDARGHARGKLAPGGWVCRIDPDGKHWEVISIGYRNAFDLAFNADDELFTYDADMEWDMGNPWYRPTRINHVTSGSEFGWRSGTGKWPAYYVDSLPEVVNIGPGSPVGVTFGYGAKFPGKYQRALFALDWTFGTIYAVHIRPQGASYVGEKEEFVSRKALPVTDAQVGPDGALYFTVGGRNAQSALYRVSYVGTESVVPVNAKNSAFQTERRIRRQLEAFHVRADNQKQAIDFIWRYLGHHDRHIRYAARVALEHQEVDLWTMRALQEMDAQTRTTALVALVRQGESSLQDQILKSLGELPMARFNEALQLEVMRVYALSFIRLGRPDTDNAREVATRLDFLYPSSSTALNHELSRLLVYLNWPTVIDKTLAKMREESVPSSKISTTETQQLIARNANFGNAIGQMLAKPPQTENLHYAFVLRNLRFGWTLEQRQEYFSWLDDALERGGGASYEGFIKNIRAEALENASEQERQLLDLETAEAAPFNPDELPQPQGPGRKWTVEEIVRLTREGLQDRDYQHGSQIYAAAKCVACHRFAAFGGTTGPDLTNLAGRFSMRDLAEALIDPSRTIPDRYRAMVILTNAGLTIQGRVVNEDDDHVVVVTDAYDHTKVKELAKSEIDEMTAAKKSLMPDGLLDSLNRDELLDLLAFLMSRGNSQDLMFTADVSN